MATLRCRTCGKVIIRYSGHIGKEARLKSIRTHYKKYHPDRFKKFAKKAVATKEELRLKGNPSYINRMSKHLQKEHPSTKGKIKVIKFKTKSGKVVCFKGRCK